ncbi:MAG: type II secretion system GspH family protein [Pirellulales bacterium]|nr:type II secretion system GspH family protein [Pirellulales bacterium]
MRKERSGFSLLEMLAVVVLLGIIATLVVPRVANSSLTARSNTTQHILSSLNSAIEQYQLDHGSYPSSLKELVPDYLPDGVPACPEVGGQFTINEKTNRAEVIH